MTVISVFYLQGCVESCSGSNGFWHLRIRTYSSKFNESLSTSHPQVQKAFPTEAVKHIHDKPGTHPRHEHHAHAKHDDQRVINQPRK